MKRYLVIAIMPLLILVCLTSIACLIGFGMVEVMGDPSALRKLIIRLTQLFLVLSIYPAMRFLMLSKQDLGLAEKKIFFKQLLQGFGIGLLSLLPVFILLYGLGISVFDETQSWTIGLAAKKTSLSLLLALLIGVVEESVFRGMLFSGLRNKLPVIAAIIISSVYFAGLHFLDAKTQIAEQDFTVFSGFYLLGEAYANVFNSKNVSAFLALFMVGSFLAVLRTQVKESLGLCIGCHAGWVWLIKMNGSIFNTNYASTYIYLVSDYNFVIGPLVTVWLIMVIAGFFLFKKISRAKSISEIFKL